ncbi:SMK killer toxin resistance protein [Oleoguttula sp. CCFEE 5521]
MATFLTDLWESVFTPGPTSTLLVATNVSFGSLQLLLLGLLLATYSIHFIILSVLCGGLWWSINWFASEVSAVRREEEEKERLAKLDGKRGVGGEGSEGDDEGETTEVEDEVSRSIGDLRTGGTTVSAAEEVRSSGLEVPTVAAARQRMPTRSGSGSGNGDGVRSEMSTDSEWEKVDGER